MNKTILTVLAAAVVIALAAYGIFSGQQGTATDANSMNPAAGEASIEQQAEGTPSQAQQVNETAEAAAEHAEEAADAAAEHADHAEEAADAAADAAGEAEKAADTAEEAAH
ncbi:MAG: hypothetical protein GC136_04430 [Alphaproteobacteria bacterium]|nr:hypothetical protein [Alphaproteobacteria bacterium]